MAGLLLQWNEPGQQKLEHLECLAVNLVSNTNCLSQCINWSYAQNKLTLKLRLLEILVLYNINAADRDQVHYW